MSQSNEKVRHEASLVGKLLSMETLIFVMGCLSLWYGFTEDKSINIFWGATILIGFVILRKVRRKDWDKHWAEMESEQSLLESRRKNRKKSENLRE
ncbi:MAG: hypothetical protein WCP20_13575 [Desulfuromonadales bacterium]